MTEYHQQGPKYDPELLELIQQLLDSTKERISKAKLIQKLTQLDISEFEFREALYAAGVRYQEAQAALENMQQEINATLISLWTLIISLISAAASQAKRSGINIYYASESAANATYNSLAKIHPLHIPIITLIITLILILLDITIGPQLTLDLFRLIVQEVPLGINGSPCDAQYDFIDALNC